MDKYKGITPEQRESADASYKAHQELMKAFQKSENVIAAAEATINRYSKPGALAAEGQRAEDLTARMRALQQERKNAHGVLNLAFPSTPAETFSGARKSLESAMRDVEVRVGLVGEILDKDAE